MSRLRVRNWTVAALTAGALGLLGATCTAVDPNEPAGQLTATGLTLAEVKAELGAQHPLYSDVPAIEIPPEMLESTDEQVQDVADVLNVINSYRDAFLTEELLKIASRESGGGSWDQYCTYSFGVSVCTYEQRRGDGTVWSIMSVHNDGLWTVIYARDGCDGTHQWDNFEYQVYSVNTKVPGVVTSLLTINQKPDRPPCGGTAEIPDGPLVTTNVQYMEYSCIYTHIQYIPIHKDDEWEYAIMYKDVVITAPDGSSSVATYRPKGGLLGADLFLWRMTGYTTNPRAICWTTFKEDGSVAGCGGDSGSCPGC